MKNNSSPTPIRQAHIRMEGVSKTFRGSSAPVTVLKDINIDIAAGEFVSIVGRSGSGKSTLLNMLTGIDHPSQGKVVISGTKLHHLSESQLASWRGKNLGIVFQFFQLLPMLSLLENTMLPMDLCEMFPAASRAERALKLLQLVGLKDFVHQMPGAVSGGQQQLAAVARALANDPPILIADEPTGNLDSKTAGEVMNLFQQLSHQGKTIVMVTHDQSLASQTQRSLLLSDGELIEPALSLAFPKLKPAVLLKIQHLSQRLVIPVGSAIPQSVEMLVIASGKLTVNKQLFGRGKLLDCASLQKAGQAFYAYEGAAEILALDVPQLRQLAESIRAGEKN